MTKTDLWAIGTRGHQFGIWDFGHCYLFVIWCLVLGISQFAAWFLLRPLHVNSEREFYEEAAILGW
jgi:hypothetical protein